MVSSRKSKPPKTKPGECTGFQLHKKQQTIYSGILDDILDFTEFKLSKYIEGINEPEEVKLLNLLLDDYRQGKVAVAWNKGVPISINIVKG